MKYSKLVVCTVAVVTFALTASSADARKRYRAAGGVTVMQNNTGGRPTRVISRGATGADTITNNSAAGGNALQPARAGSGGSGGGGTGAGGS